MGGVLKVVHGVVIPPVAHVHKAVLPKVHEEGIRWSPGDVEEDTKYFQELGKEALV